MVANWGGKYEYISEKKKRLWIRIENAYTASVSADLPVEQRNSSCLAFIRK